MSRTAELRILTGCHAGARAAVVGGERVGPGEDCDLIITDLGLPQDGGAWIQLHAERWSVGSAAPQADGASSAPWVAEQAWGTVAFLGQVAITVCDPDAAWQRVPASLSAGHGSQDRSATPESSDAQDAAESTLLPVLPSNGDAASAKEMPADPELGVSQAAPGAGPLVGAEHADEAHALRPPVPTRRLRPAWVIGAALVVLLVSVFWSLLQGRDADALAKTAGIPPDGAVEPERQQRLLKDIQLAIAQVDPSLRLRVEALPTGGARVSGWVADVGQLDRLADGLAAIRPAPALAVRTAAELVEDLVDVGATHLPGLRVDLLGEGKVRASGVVLSATEREPLLALLRSRVPPGIDIVDGLRVAPEQGAAVQAWLRAAGFPQAVAHWEGEQMVIGVDIHPPERPRLESLLARTSTPLAGIPFVLKTREVADAARAPSQSMLHASQAPLPFRIRSVVGGATPYIVLGDGSKLQPGGRKAGWRLVAVEPDRLVFDGPRSLMVQR